MKKLLMPLSVLTMYVLFYMIGRGAGFTVGFAAGREEGFREGWEACENDSSCDWGEWR